METHRRVAYQNWSSRVRTGGYLKAGLDRFSHIIKRFPMANLADIIAATRRKVSEYRSESDLRQLERQASLHVPRGFRAALESTSESGIAIIAELKKLSQSRGLFGGIFVPRKFPGGLDQAEGAALSVRKEEKSF